MPFSKYLENQFSLSGRCGPFPTNVSAMGTKLQICILFAARNIGKNNVYVTYCFIKGDPVSHTSCKVGKNYIEIHAKM